ncbi:MAG: radical SAM protein [Mediterraneibacter gnavus]
MDPYLCSLIDQLEQEHTLSASQWIQLLNGRTPELAAYLFEKSRRAQIRFYGHTVYIRGLIEFTNYCRNNCYYCGIRSGNTHAHRYRLTKEDILACCADGYKLGFRTFVLQGGEDPWYTNGSIIRACISTISAPCARTVPSHFLPEKQSKAEYQQLFDAGADRFLLRHETHNADHYTASCIRRVYWHPTDSNVSGT